MYTQPLQDSLKHSIESGNQYYQEGKYQDAIDSYLFVIDQKYENANLFYNLGNAYYKINEPAKAILWYERALVLNPSNEDIKHNIAFVNQKLEDKIEIIPKLFITEWYLGVAYSLTSNQWAVLSIVACFLLTLSVLIFLFLRRGIVKSASFFTGILFLITVIFSVHFAYKISHKNEKDPEAIVMRSVLTGKSTPDEAGNDLFVIHQGIKVIITDQLNDWIEIKLSNGEKGWVRYTDIEKI